MTKIYNGRNPTESNFIGHMDDAGVVYNHWSREGMENTVGHVDKDGVVYNHWSREGIEYAVGHVDKDGIVYSHWSREGIENTVGHVGKDGAVYNHWSREGIENSVGCVRGESTYAAGAAFLLLLNASFRDHYIDETPPVRDDKHFNELVEREYQRKLAEERARLRREAYQRYLKNPSIVAAAKEYAQQRKKPATIFTIFFITVCSIRGFKGMSADAVIPVFGVFGLFILAMCLFIRHVTYKDAFRKKVWELGEQGYGKEPVPKAEPKAKNTPLVDDKMPTPKKETKPAPKPVEKPVTKPKQQTVETQISACPYCGAKFRAPIGVGTLKITCPNPDCKKQFMMDT